MDELNDKYIKKLKKFSKKVDVEIFDNSKHLITSDLIKKKIQKEKKRKVNDFYKSIKNLSQTNSINTNKIKNLNNKFIKEIDNYDNLDNLLDGINYEDTYIEIFSN
jgi:hypothetical protein